MPMQPIMQSTIKSLNNMNVESMKHTTIMKTSRYILILALALCCAAGNLYAITSSYYSTIDGKKDSGLREALTTLLYDKHTTGLSYDWDFDGIDWDNSGNIYDIYSDCGHKKTDETSSYKCCCDAINREHVVPQSTFDSKYPQYADRHHLYVVDGKVNGYRSNYAFGECSGGAKGSCSNSSTVKPSEGTQTCSNHEFGKLGTSTFTEVKISDKVYEPGDEYKGDIARAIMYMVVRYATTDYCKVKSGSGSGSANAYPVTAWSASSNVGLMFSNSLSTNYGLSAYGKALLLKWHRNDPVSAKEIARNNGVEAKQGNRNPFVDYPCLVEYLWGNKAGETVSLSDLVGTFTGSWTTGDGCPCGDVPAITLPTGDIFVGSTEANQSVTKTITVQGVNLTGTLSLALSGTNSSLFSINATTMLKASAEAGSSLTITYSPTAAGNHTATLTISGGGLSSGQTFALSGTCCNPYVVTLSRNGITETVGACGTFTLPTAEDEVSACDGWEFKGWLASGTSFTEGTTTAPTFVTSVSGATTLHAVYGQTSGGGSSSVTLKASEDTEFPKNGITLTTSNGVLDNGTDYRIYKGATLTITSTVGNMSNIALTYQSASYDGGGWASSYSPNATTWTSPATTSGNSGEQARITTIVITLSGTATTIYKKLPCATYTISYADADGIATGGSYQASATTALAGTTITLDYDEALGYEFTGWTVTKAGGGSVTVTSNQFTMPEADVTVKANFTALCSKLDAPEVSAMPGDGQITLTWPDVVGADHYTVTISKGEGYTTECGSAASVGSINSSAGTNTCVISGLTNGLEYTTSVVANSVSSICDSDVDEDTVTPTAELPTTVTVTFDANGGTGTMSDQVIGYNTATVLTENAYTLTGYTFHGWATEQGSAKVYDNGASVTLTESVTLYAVWQINSHNVTFTPSITGATVKVNNSSTSPQSVNYGTTVTIAVTPDAHYTLTGISVSDTDEGNVALSGEGNTRTFVMPDEEVTVTVTMTEETKYTVNWYVAGSATEETNYAGEALAGIDNPEIDCNGKVFVGWTTSSSYDSDDAPNDLFTDATSKTMPSNNMNYYAVFADEVGGGGGENLIEYDGSGKATLENIVGVTQSGLSSDYSSGTHGEYILKFDSDNDYIQFALSSVPSSLSFNYKMIGGASTSTMTIKESAAADGTYTDVQALTISGSQNSTGTLTTTNAFTQKYVRMVFTKGSNVGVGKITIAGSSTSYSGYTTSCTAPTEVTITFDANGGSGTMADQVIDYNTTTALYANEFTRTGYEFVGWNTAADGSGTAYNDEAEVKLTRDITLYAQWKAIYTIRFYDNGTMISEQTVLSGEQADKPADREGCGDYAFEGWWTAELANDNTMAQTWVTNFTAKQDKDYYAVYSYSETSGGGGVESNVVDVLTRATTGVTGTSYSDWSDKKGTSGSVYAGQSSGGNSSIQLRATSPSGIVTTTSGGTATKVTVDWNATTTAGRVLNVYGKNTAYEAATDLYNTSTQGTLIGTIVYGTSTELTIQDDYAYIGLRSASGAMYLTSISITWSTSGGSSTTTYYTTSALCTAVVNWYVMDTPTAEEKYVGEELEGITAPEQIEECFGTKEFVGWTATSDYKSADQPLDLFDDPSIVTMPAEGANYYAVYATPASSDEQVADEGYYGFTTVCADYTRTVTEGNFGTICLPNAIDRGLIDGVHVYSIKGKFVKDGKLVAVSMEDETGDLNAGQPYVIQATSSTLKAWLGEETVDEAVETNGLVGNLSNESLYAPIGSYVLSKNQLRRVAAENVAKVGINKAYFDLKNVDILEMSQIQHARVMYSADSETVVTEVDEVSDQTSSINWDEPVYNVLGQRVDMSATGVLIQGGRKFIVDN